MLTTRVKAAPSERVTALLDAIMSVESGGRTDAVGDGGDALGAFQIHQAYWIDSRLPGVYTDCRDPAYAKLVVLAYWSRYCPQALANGDLEELARVHNGGPAGASNPKTQRYWQRVQRHLPAE